MQKKDTLLPKDKKQKKQIEQKNDELSEKEVQFKEDSSPDKEVKSKKENLPQKPVLTKKNKIIISSVAVIVVLIGVILAIVLGTMKIFTMTPNDEFDFVNHRHIEVINKGDNIFTTEMIYNNGVQKFYTSGQEHYGLFSFVENKNILEPLYNSADIGVVSHDTESKKTYFQINKASEPKNVYIIDEHGKTIDILNYNTTKNVTESHIMTRTISQSEKKDKVSTKIANKFHEELVTIKSATLREIFYVKDKYFYELWDLTTEDNITYQNLYKIEDNKHTLIQTLNNEIGIALDSQDLSVGFLIDGTPMLYGSRYVAFDGDIQVSEISAYDINFNLKGQATISANKLKQLTQIIKVGDKILLQFEETTTEKDYTYSTTDIDGKTSYYNLETYTLSLKNYKFTQVSFNYKILNAYGKYTQNINPITSSISFDYNGFNPEVALINAKAISRKKLGTSQNLLINKRLQTKELSFEFNHLTKINNDRYLASIDGTDNFNLIDSRYNLVAHLENFSDVFATSDAIIAQDDSYSYVCNVDGIVLKKYTKANITNIHDNQYYLRKQTTSSGSDILEEYFLEQQGYSDTPLYTYSQADGYKMKNNSFSRIEVISNKAFTILLAVKRDGSSFTYEFYNIEGQLLTSQNGLMENHYTPTYSYYDDSHVVLEFMGHIYLMDR